MALTVFNPSTLENRPLSETELAALYPRTPEDDESSPPPMQALGPQSEGETSDVPPVGDEPAEEPPPFSLAEGEVLIDWETHLYDFAGGQVVPIYRDARVMVHELRETLGGHIVKLESRLAALEARLPLEPLPQPESDGED